LGLRELIELDTRDREPRLASLLGGHRVHALTHESDEIVPAFLTFEEPLELTELPLIVRPKAQDRLQITDRAIGSAREVFRRLRRLFEQGEPPILFRSARDLSVVEPEEIIPALGGGIGDRQPR